MKAELRALVRRRAMNRCEYCGAAQEFEPFLLFHVEHIVPRQHGGSDEEGNLALACPHCNFHKGTNLTGIDPESGIIFRLFHPRQDRWGEHFQEDGALITGLTAIGRTTVHLLKMNEPARVELRSCLMR